jgi:hypothetical protein
MKRNMFRSVSAALLAALLAAPVPAVAWRAWNRHEVLPVSNGVFEVVAEIGYGTAAPDYWCAAGDFAIREMGVPSNTRLYVWQPEGPSVNRERKKAVQFSTFPPPNADTSTQLTLTVRRAGDNLSASFAQNYCYQNIDARRPWVR